MKLLFALLVCVFMQPLCTFSYPFEPPVQIEQLLVKPINDLYESLVWPYQNSTDRFSEVLGDERPLIASIEHKSFHFDPFNYSVQVHVVMAANLQKHGFTYQFLMSETGTYFLDEDFNIVGEELEVDRIDERLLETIWDLYQRNGCGKEVDPFGYYEDEEDFVSYSSGAPITTLMCRAYYVSEAKYRPETNCLYMSKSVHSKCD